MNLATIKSTLLTSGIQRDQPQLYQAINQMIDLLNITQGRLDVVETEAKATKQLLSDVIRLNSLITP